jgi:hypothetical protein
MDMTLLFRKVWLGFRVFSTFRKAPKATVAKVYAAFGDGIITEAEWVQIGKDVGIIT